MKIGLIDVDGHNFPNLALMRISTYHKARGDSVEWWWGWGHYDIVYMSKIFSDAYFPAADVAPVRNARWKRYGKNLGEGSECGEIVSVRGNYCPNCGAKMDGGADNG